MISINESEGIMNKRPYHKPQLEQVQLVSEETVLLQCKTTTGGSIPQCRNKSLGCNKTSTKS